MNFIAQETSKAEKAEIEQLFKASEKDLSMRLPHLVFMDVIATNPKHQGRQDLDYLDPRCEEIIKDCQVQFLQDHMDQKKQSIVNEDKTHSILQKRYSLELLTKAMKSIIAEIDPSLMLLQYFEDQVKENPKRQEYFVQKGLEKSEAFACALVLSFYTGYAGYGTHTSSRINRGASQEARTTSTDASSSEIRSYSPILYYLMKALAYIPDYRGACLRLVELTESEQKRYQVGSIVSWIQFTSSTEISEAHVSHFSSRNTVLHIFSISGKRIQSFSNFSGEKEVVHAPWCNFLVVKKEQIGDKTHIYVRQVELRTSKNTILWVDDSILDENWENKALMESLITKGLEKNLRIIPKTSTKLALAFADSPFGQYILKYLPENFQIITNMERLNEENGPEAGAILIKELRQRDFKQQFTVYTSDQNKTFKALTKHAGSLLKGTSNYEVITKQSLLEVVVPLQNTSPSQGTCQIF